MKNDPIKSTILGRWNPKHDEVGHLKDGKVATAHSLDINDAIRAEHTRIANDPKRTSLGKLDDMRSVISGEMARDLYIARRRVEQMAANLEAWRARLKPAAPDRNDVAAAVLRSEVRSMLRGLSNGARVKLLLGDGADPALQAAVLEAPDVMSGLTPDLRAQLEIRVIEATHPGQLAAIEEAEEVVTLARTAYTITANAARAAGEFPDNRSLENFVVEAVGQRAGQYDASVKQTFSAFGAAA